MKYVKLYLVVFLLCFHQSMYSQITFEKKYNDTDYVWGSDIVQTGDSGYLIVGNIHDDKFLYPTQYVLRTDKNGNTLWKYNYRSPALGLFPTVMKINDDDFAIWASESNSIDFADVPSIRRVNISGNEKYHKLFRELIYLNIDKILITSDSCWLLVGPQTSILGHTGLILSKVSWKGDTIWTKKYISPNFINMFNPVQYNVIDINDSCFTVAENDSSNKLFITTLTFNGDTLWSRQLAIESTQSKETPIDLLLLDDNIFLYTSISKNSSLKLYKFDRNGNELWRTAHPIKANIKLVKTGSTSILGYGADFSDQATLVFFDTSGNIIKQQTFGNVPGQFMSMKKTLDGGFIFTGYFKDDICLVKTDSLGNVTKNPQPTFVNTLNYLQDIIIAPNPSSGSFQIVMQPGIFEHSFQIIITDITGKEIFNQTDCPNRTCNITMPVNSKGIYYIRLVNSKYSVARKIIID